MAQSDSALQMKLVHRNTSTAYAQSHLCAALCCCHGHRLQFRRCVCVCVCNVCMTESQRRLDCGGDMPASANTHKAAYHTQTERLSHVSSMCDLQLHEEQRVT